MKSIKVDIAGLAKASTETRKLTADLNKLRAIQVNLAVSASGIAQAPRQLNALRTSASRPVTARPLATGFGVHAAAGVIGRATREGTRDVDVLEATHQGSASLPTE